MVKEYITKDSGKRQEFSTGMQRDVQDGKKRYDLIYPELLQRVLVKHEATLNDKDDFRTMSIRVIADYISLSSRVDSNKSEDIYDAMTLNFIKFISKLEHIDIIEIIDRWQGVMARGAQKYNDWNWTKAKTTEEYDRFFASGFRHLMQYIQGEDDEDHAAGVLFNIGGMAYVSKRLEKNDKSCCGGCHTNSAGS